MYTDKIYKQISLSTHTITLIKRLLKATENSDAFEALL